MQPPPPPPPLAGAWLGLCGRVASIGQNGNEGGVAKGICLQLNATGACVTLSHYTVWETQYLASTQYIHIKISCRFIRIRSPPVSSSLSTRACMALL